MSNPSSVPMSLPELPKCVSELPSVDGGYLRSETVFYALLFLQSYSALKNFMFRSLLTGSLSSLCSCWSGFQLVQVGVAEGGEAALTYNSCPSRAESLTLECSRFPTDHKPLLKQLFFQC